MQARLRFALIASVVLILGGVALLIASREVPLFCRAPDYDRAEAPAAFPAAEWVAVADPARLGWNVERLAAAADAAQKAGLGAVMVIDDGRLVHASGCTETRWFVASVRKSLMSAVIGLDIADGRLTLATTLADLGIDDSPPLSPAERATPLARLLTSSAGICRPSAAGQTCTPAEAAAREVPFIYDNWGFNVLWSVHQAAAEVGFFGSFAARIARPIGMDFDPRRDGRLQRIGTSPHPAYVMDLSAADMARFGLLYLRGGVWDGRQVLPADWVADSSRAHVVTGTAPGAPGYGYLWWVHGEGNAIGLPPGSFAAEGDWLQAIIVIPAWQAVVVLRGNIPRLAVFGRPGEAELKAVLGALLAARQK